MRSIGVVGAHRRRGLQILWAPSTSFAGAPPRAGEDIPCLRFPLAQILAQRGGEALGLVLIRFAHT